MEDKKKTVGQVSLELSQKEPDTRDPIELEREMHTDYEKNFWECVNDFKKQSSNDFFIVVLTKRERVMQNVLRNVFFARHSCPTPNYDQAVYRYDALNNAVDFIWVIPSRETCFMLKENALQVVPEEKELLKYVLDFADGTLYNLAKQLNKEDENGRIESRTKSNPGTDIAGIS